MGASGDQAEQAADGDRIGGAGAADDIAVVVSGDFQALQRRQLPAGLGERSLDGGADLDQQRNIDLYRRARLLTVGKPVQ
ncbi:hypothetical protein DF3PA_80049 [Candidatus Defluviicoccus seviourii]|uniref:Uncharacterized protein n=1 Tax=Candidatus Defluviicoccus seviourii TaxID=2565273 RepID=A0A564WIH5_9PROT|nr:hypothetical protein DF3PA_80049 [Candidatus Defluviicoccus seviourii]